MKLVVSIGAWSVRHAQQIIDDINEKLGALNVQSETADHAPDSQEALFYPQSRGELRSVLAAAKACEYEAWGRDDDSGEEFGVEDEIPD